jgi:hypothetical protein
MFTSAAFSTTVSSSSLSPLSSMEKQMEILKSNQNLYHYFVQITTMLYIDNPYGRNAILHPDQLTCTAAFYI